jgi:hypothetical protein
MPVIRNKAKRNLLPRRSGPKGIAARIKRRVASYEPKPSTCEARFLKGYNKPGSENPRKVGR